MTETSRHLSDLMFPLILIAFLALYIGGIVAGTEPEYALARAGIASVVLAGLCRLAGTILDAAPKPQPEPAAPEPEFELAPRRSRGQRLDVAIGDSPEMPPKLVSPAADLVQTAKE